MDNYASCAFTISFPTCSSGVVQGECLSDPLDKMTIAIWNNGESNCRMFQQTQTLFQLSLAEKDRFVRLVWLGKKCLFDGRVVVERGKLGLIGWLGKWQV